MSIMGKVLVRFENEYHGLQVTGFKIVTDREWQLYERRILQSTFPRSICLNGWNFDIRDAHEHLDCFVVAPINDHLAAILTSEFSGGEFGFVLWLPEEEPEEEILI